MDAKERNRIFDKHWPALQHVIYRIWSRYSTVRRIGTLDDVKSEAALAVLSAIENFTPAAKYDSPEQADGHMKSYLVSAIHRTLTYKSRCSSLLHVPAHVAASVFAGEDDESKAAVHCKQFDNIPVVMSESDFGDEEHTVGDLQTALSRLQPGERDMISKFWGLDGEKVSLRELAIEAGLTRNAARRRIRAIESKLKLMMTRD